MPGVCVDASFELAYRYTIMMNCHWITLIAAVDFHVLMGSAVLCTGTAARGTLLSASDAASAPQPMPARESTPFEHTAACSEDCPMCQVSAKFYKAGMTYVSLVIREARCSTPVTHSKLRVQC